MLQCGEGNSRADFIAPLREACEAPERANEQIPTGTGTALHYCTCASSETLLPWGKIRYTDLIGARPFKYSRAPTRGPHVCAPKTAWRREWAEMMECPIARTSVHIQVCVNGTVVIHRACGWRCVGDRDPLQQSYASC